MLVCSNLCFHGDLGIFQTRQTTNVADRLPDLIRGAIRKLPEQARKLVANFDRYRETKVGPGYGNQALVDIYRHNGFTPNQLARAIDEWHEPSFDKHREMGWSAWRLFNAATQALKPTGTSGSPIILQQRSQVVHKRLEATVH